MIKDMNMPILGLNTDPQRSVGHLLNGKIDHDKRQMMTKSIFMNLEHGNFEYFYRQRFNFTFTNNMNNETQS